MTDWAERKARYDRMATGLSVSHPHLAGYADAIRELVAEVERLQAHIRGFEDLCDERERQLARVNALVKRWRAESRHPLFYPDQAVLSFPALEAYADSLP